MGLRCPSNEGLVLTVVGDLQTYCRKLRSFLYTFRDRVNTKSFSLLALYFHMGFTSEFHKDRTRCTYNHHG